MSDSSILQRASLGAWLEAMGRAGRRVLAPVCKGDRVVFATPSAPEQIATGFVQTPASAKSVVFPPYDEMLRFRANGEDVHVEEPSIAAEPTVLFGVRPCDAAGFATLKAVFTWDSPDAWFESRMANLTVISVSCTQCDEYCFCTSVGGGPGSTQGSDILLTPLDDRRWLVEVLTEKGKAVAALAPQLFAPANGEAANKDKVLANVPVRFEAGEVAQRLSSLFDRTEVWKEESLRCLGCGACAFVCPTCSCFDIQDERVRDQGLRLRCWDSCGFRLFTLHASGHNPRRVQSERWRQRVMHKFSYQPERLGVTGCVGCGRCSRACPVDMNLGEHVRMLSEMSV